MAVTAITQPRLIEASFENLLNYHFRGGNGINVALLTSELVTDTGGFASIPRTSGLEPYLQIGRRIRLNDIFAPKEYDFATGIITGFDNTKVFTNIPYNGDGDPSTEIYVADYPLTVYIYTGYEASNPNNSNNPKSLKHTLEVPAIWNTSLEVADYYTNISRYIQDKFNFVPPNENNGWQNIVPYQIATSFVNPDSGAIIDFEVWEYLYATAGRVRPPEAPTTLTVTEKRTALFNRVLYNKSNITIENHVGVQTGITSPPLLQDRINPFTKIL